MLSTLPSTTSAPGTAPRAPEATGPAPSRQGAELFPELDLSDPRNSTGPDARAMSKVLFARLAELEEGTHEYQYVRNTLVELNLTLVKFAARRFRTRSEPMEDIVQVGTIGLIKAIDRFDVDQETEFPTFALPTIVGEIKRFFRDTSWAVHVPRRLQELRLTLARATDDLATVIGRPPTPAELAAHLEISEDEVREGLVAANGYTVSSIDAGAPGEEDDESTSFTARLGEVDPGMDMVVNLESLRPLMARLGERDKAIISMRFGAEMTQSEIGAALGISQMHVSRLLSRTLGQLRDQLLTQD
ncbi:RNA polymerase sigma factor SigF [Streptacidiphilus sp. P02-A3a]|uniref:RNA polymerase sigma factor SigF n=1 Tax=Streptacidiphilus sp. P02-A3a TaxID=2704468 RepID=UPI0015F900F3|nr:RNA polymerase sigma factor SigF [Streptacidiphilus sp. P02-A3a]QMU71652.1 RNA polymerase sigma factor SigF [Streptacidiphilus sp. P02-A3a]